MDSTTSYTYCTSTQTCLVIPRPALFTGYLPGANTYQVFCNTRDTPLPDVRVKLTQSIHYTDKLVIQFGDGVVGTIAASEAKKLERDAYGNISIPTKMLEYLPELPEAAERSEYDFEFN